MPLLIRLFNQRLDAYKGQFADNKWEIPAQDEPMPIVFCLTGDPSANALLDAYGLHEKAKNLKPQGYLLEIGSKGVLAMGADNPGLINALASMPSTTFPPRMSG
jgi:hypothetical protein